MYYARDDENDASGWRTRVTSFRLGNFISEHAHKIDGHSAYARLCEWNRMMHKIIIIIIYVDGGRTQSVHIQRLT